MTFWVKQTTQWENKRNHSYHTCKFDIDWISIHVLLKISKINANFDIIAACSSSPIFTSEGFVVSTFRQTLRLMTLKIYY